MLFGEEEVEDNRWKNYDSDGRGNNRSHVLKRNKNNLIFISLSFWSDFYTVFYGVQYSESER
jgi:hypothetical protein